MPGSPMPGTPLWAVLALLAVRTVAAGSPPANRWTGQVEVLSLDLKDQRSTQEVYLRAAAEGPGTGVVRYQLQGQQAAGLRTGQQVAVVGRRSTAGTRSASAAAAAAGDGGTPPSLPHLLVDSVEVLSQPEYLRPRVVVTPPPGGGSRRRLQDDAALPTVHLDASTANINTLVLPISFEGCPAAGGGVYPKPWWTKQDVEGVVFEDGRASGGWTTVGGRFRTCSFGQSSMTRANSVVAPPIKLPCAGASSFGTQYGSTTCSYSDFMGWYESAWDAAQEQGINTTLYRYKLIVLPVNLPCGFIGVAHLGCGDSCAAWVQGSVFMGDPRAKAAGATHPAMHEMGHNLFMNHGTAPDDNGSIMEYGDLSDAVGQCCTTRCYNAAHAFQLGWLVPQLLNGGTLGPGQTRTVTFAAHSASRFSGLKIDPDWAPGALSLYVSYRLSERGDRFLLPQYVNKVSVHTWPGQQSTDTFKTLLVRALAKGAAYTDSSSGITVRVLSVNPTAKTASVAITRAVSRRPRKLIAA